MRRLPVLPALFASMALTACVRVSSSLLTPGTTYPPVPADSVRVFATQATATYTEVALLRAVGGYSDAKTLHVLRERAGRLGANGLLLFTPRAAGRVVVEQAENGTDDLERAVAIRYPVPAAVGSKGVSAERP